MMKSSYIRGFFAATTLALPLHLPANPAERNKIAIFVVTNNTDSDKIVVTKSTNDASAQRAVVTSVMSTDINATLKNHLDTMRSFLDLEEDDEISPVSDSALNTGLSVVTFIQQNAGELPFFIAPTRNSGILLDYRINDVKVHYWIDKSGAIEARVMSNNKTINQVHFTSLDIANMPSELIPA